ncbi:MAG: hypothetical protein KC978_19480 [Candidatus Omnitrophica bacterium]|nr:hypothetical protein [Candidatus Omnitrophota bacterium]
MTEDKSTEERLGIALLNGAVLTLIGILVLLTPIFADLDSGQKRLDGVAGFALLAVGIGLLYWHFRGPKRG